MRARHRAPPAVLVVERRRQRPVAGAVLGRAPAVRHRRRISSATPTGTSGSRRSSPNATASASGIRQFVVGTGGRSLFGFVTPVANSAVRLSAFGILKMELGDGTYTWQFVDENGTVRDSGNGTCH